MVLGPLLKSIIVNILPESNRNELKYLLKIALMFLSVIVKLQVPTLSIIILNVTRKKATVLDGPWSSSVALSSPFVIDYGNGISLLSRSLTRNAIARENHPTRERRDAAGREKNEGYRQSPGF